MFDLYAAEAVAAVLAALQGGNHLVDQVVDVDQGKLRGGVVDGNGQVVGDVVAEGCHGRVIVRTTPFSEEVRKAVDQDPGAGFGGIVAHELLAGALRFAVGIVEGRLGRRRYHHRAAVAMTLQRFEQGRGEAEVAGHELFGVLRAVDAGEVEHEVGLAAVAVELFGGGVDVVGEDLVDCQRREATVLALLDCVELGAEVAANKAARAGNEYFHITPSGFRVWCRPQSCPGRRG